MSFERLAPWAVGNCVALPKWLDAATIPLAVVIMAEYGYDEDFRLDLSRSCPSV
jgi:hypothetical protein